MSSQMTQRLVQQLERRAKLEAELLQHQRKLAQSAAEQQTLATKDSAVTAERERLQNLRGVLGQQHEALIASLRAREANDQAKRNKLSEELTARIKDVNTAVENENLEWSTALAENQRLKEKITVIKESIAAGDAKFSELLDTRQRETSSMEERSGLIETANAELQRRIEIARGVVQEKKPEHDEIRKESEQFMARFADIQAQLNAANAHFSKSKDDHMKLSKRIKQLEAERATTFHGCERAKAERDQELAREGKLEADAHALVAQTQKILDIIAALAQPA